jgi:radical SAM protein with 4Fe4S-binding SPASM domain
LPEEIVTQFHDVDISLDYATEGKHDLFRGAGAWEQAISAIERCKLLEVEVSLVMALMNINCDQITPLLQIADQFETTLRINIYKPVHTFDLALSYDQFWDSIATLFDNSQVIACSEPIVNAFVKTDPDQEGAYCGKGSIRVWPDGRVLPCVYWKNSDVMLDDFCKNPDIVKGSQEFQSITYIPEFCRQCEYVGICKGGCPARRLYHSNLAEPDPYCPIVNNRDMPKISTQVSSSSFDYVHATYLCTLIVKP